MCCSHLSTHALCQYPLKSYHLKQQKRMKIEQTCGRKVDTLMEHAENSILEYDKYMTSSMLALRTKLH